jgi:hypothetical protein
VLDATDRQFVAHGQTSLPAPDHDYSEVFSHFATRRYNVRGCDV